MLETCWHRIAAPLAGRALAACALLLCLACHPPDGSAPRSRSRSAKSSASRPTFPTYTSTAGRRTLLGIGTRCYRKGLAYNPRIFAKGGQIVIRWRADRKGDLLSFDFMRNSFGSWEVDAAGQSIETCVVAAARVARVRWSRAGIAPLRLRVGEATRATTSASSRPASRPASAAPR